LHHATKAAETTLLMTANGDSEAAANTLCTLSNSTSAAPRSTNNSHSLAKTNNYLCTAVQQVKQAT